MRAEPQACPHCGAALPYVRDAFCPECNQPLDEPPRGAAAPEGKPLGGSEGARPPGAAFAYSPLAQAALVVGLLWAVIGCVFAAGWAVVSVVQRDWLTGLVVCPICFFLQLALVVVFLRVMDLKPPA
jgi:hypothetical protein